MIINLRNCQFRKIEERNDKFRVSVLVNAIQYERLTECIAESKDRTYILSFNTEHSYVFDTLYYGDIIDVELHDEDYKYNGNIIFQ